ncbi:MAG: hydrogenase expression/formation C-terminal domain-containing protein [Pseudomonadota bacterium]
MEQTPGMEELRIEVGDALTHNVRPLLNEIRHALEKLLATGESSAIDLRSIPLAPGEEEQIEQALGTGEISAMLDAMGPSEIRETGYPGVWLVTHFNVDRQLMGKFIEITRVPDLLKSPDEDIADGLQRLAGQFAEQQ